MASSTSTPGASTSPTSSFADLLAAAEVVERQDSVQVQRPNSSSTSAACVYRPQAPQRCAMQVDAPANLVDSSAKRQRTAPTPPPTSRSLSRLLGEGKDAKLLEADQAGTPMFL